MFDDIFGFDDLIEAPSRPTISEDAQQAPVPPPPPLPRATRDLRAEEKWDATGEVWSTKDQVWNNENNQKLWEP